MTVQNPYALTSRVYDNGLDETCHRLKVSMLAYSPLAFGALTGKYDQSGFTGDQVPNARIANYESVRKQRWGRDEALVAAKRYNQLAKDHGLSPTQMALAFCYHRWSVTSTIIGVTSANQFETPHSEWRQIITATDFTRHHTASFTPKPNWRRDRCVT
jgi:aryl-alcohol dehydrogenase-like predicted oxidoreductase